VIYFPDIKDPAIIVGETQLVMPLAIVTISPDSLDYDLLRSVINYKADVVKHGEYLAGSIEWHGLTHAQHLTLKSLQGTEARIWPFGTGAIAGTSPTRYYPYVDCVIKRVYPYHRNNAYYMDAVIIEFESSGEYTLARAVDTGITPT